MKVVAFVPIKLDNERLPGKNLRMMIDKRPLISRILETTSNIGIIDEKYVFCSSKEVVSYLPRGVNFLERNPKLDGPQVKAMELINGFVDAVDADVYVLLHATAPFLSAKTIEECINAVTLRGHDSACPVVEIRDYIWTSGKPNYDLSNIPRTQDLEPILVETSGLFVFTKQCFLENNARIGKNPYFHKVSRKEATDIDYLEDFELANAYIITEQTLNER
ncbi:MAG: acylneuraminate cytidylyltransferase family protein [Defluviitaleaceae bacterium]|nr:acylneuraminate cytidylyltransferase family protein [Defluviitaleaceae bacterium]